MGSDMTEDLSIDVTMQDGLSISLAGSVVQYSTNPLVRDAMGKNHRDAQVLQAQDSLSQDIANMRQAQEAGQEVEPTERRGRSVVFNLDSNGHNGHNGKGKGHEEDEEPKSQGGHRGGVTWSEPPPCIFTPRA